MSRLDVGFHVLMESLSNMDSFIIFILIHSSDSPVTPQFFHPFKRYFLNTPVFAHWGCIPTKHSAHMVIRKMDLMCLQYTWYVISAVWN